MIKHLSTKEANKYYYQECYSCQQKETRKIGNREIEIYDMVEFLEKKAKERVEKRSDPYTWVYANLERYGNCLVSDETYAKLNKSKLGKHTIEESLKEKTDVKVPKCYIIWK